MISKSTFVGQFITDISDHYKTLKELGSGSYGTVYRVQNKITGDIRACKKLNKRKIKNKERFKIEIDLLKATDHPNIVKLYEIYEDNVYLYLIMEECVGGEFFDRLSARAKSSNLYTEKDAAKIFKQIMSALNYMHSHGVCHRDIKPENILFTSIEDDSTLKIIDFGLSKVFSAQNHAMNSIVGTTYYMAPEVLKGEYDEKCDVWSAGVILYIMLCGRPPFYGKTDNEIMKKIHQKSFTFNYPEWNKVSKDVKTLISKILVDTDNRPTCQDILDCSWVTELAPGSTDENLTLDFENLISYANLNKLQKTVISFASFRLKDEDTKLLAEIFKSFDKNSDGVLTVNEVKDGFTALKEKKISDSQSESNGSNTLSTDEEMEELFKQMDLDKNGLINYNEFISATIDYKNLVKQEQIYEAFRNFDSDKSGKLSLKELSEVIKSQTQEDVDYLKNIFKKLDVNNDGEVDWDEFLKGLDIFDDVVDSSRSSDRSDR